jgi:hypothetical protein
LAACAWATWPGAEGRRRREKEEGRREGRKERGRRGERRGETHLSRDRRQLHSILLRLLSPPLALHLDLGRLCLGHMGLEHDPFFFFL